MRGTEEAASIVKTSLQIRRSVPAWYATQRCRRRVIAKQNVVTPINPLFIKVNVCMYDVEATPISDSLSDLIAFKDENACWNASHVHIGRVWVRHTAAARPARI